MTDLIQYIIASLHNKYKDLDTDEFVILCISLIKDQSDAIELKSALLKHIETHYPFEHKRISKLISIA